MPPRQAKSDDDHVVFVFSFAAQGQGSFEFGERESSKKPLHPHQLWLSDDFLLSRRDRSDPIMKKRGNGKSPDSTISSLIPVASQLYVWSEPTRFVRFGSTILELEQSEHGSGSCGVGQIEFAPDRSPVLSWPGSIPLTSEATFSMLPWCFPDSMVVAG